MMTVFRKIEMTILIRGVLLALALAFAPSVGQARVIFQNTGTLSGWSNFPQRPCCGTIREVSSPAFKLLLANSAPSRH